jgi:selenium metabolism protein YedF
MEHIIDCKGLLCPEPVINTKKYFDSIKEGSAIVMVDNEVAKNNVLKFAKSSGFDNTVTENNELYCINITKNLAYCKPMFFENKKLVILICSNKLGDGADALGYTLMKSYLYALSESDTIPSDLLFLNSGVKLTMKKSDCLESIRKLEKRGVNILSCGTCIDFYGLKEELDVGEITNMYTIVQILNSADNTVKL